MVNPASRVGALMMLAAFCALPQTSFRQLHLTAFDKSGQAVTDLTPSDLKLIDNGKPQSILSLRFNRNRQTSRAAPNPPGLFNQAGLEGPHVIILLDFLNGNLYFRSGTFEDTSMASSILQGIEGAEEPERIYLYLLTSRASLVPVRPILPASAAAPPEEHWPAQAKHMLDDAIAKTNGVTPPAARVPVNVAVSSYHAVRELAAVAAGLPGPTSIVWVTYGFPMHMNVPESCQTIVSENIALPCKDQWIDFSPVEELIAGEMVQSRILLWTVDEMQIPDPRGNEMLQTFSRLTAARSYLRGETPKAVTAAFAAMRLYYTLIYQPPEANWDGKFHAVEVTCARKNVLVQVEGGYIAEAHHDLAPMLIARAAASARDIPAIGLRATARRGNGPNIVHLDVRVSIPDLFLVPQDDHFAGELVVDFVGLSDQRRLELAKPRLLKLRLTPTHVEELGSGVDTTADLELPESANRTVRMIVVDRWAGRVGSLTVPITW